MEQIKFEDIENSNYLNLLPGRTAYIDECGNFGFNFENKEVSGLGGSSLYYIVCAVIVKDKDIPALEIETNRIHNNNGFQTGELKSSLIGNNNKRRTKILTEFLTLDFSLVILIANKQKFYGESPLSNYKESFIKYLHQKLYDEMYATYPKLKIVEDEYRSSAFQIGYRKYVCANRPQLNLFNEYDFYYVNSKYSLIVQIADIIAGSVMQYLLDDKAPNVIKIFQSKIRGLVDFPSTYPSFRAGINKDKRFDENIYSLANYCATKYIESHTNVNDKDERMRVIFLKYLIWVVLNIKPHIYISSREIIDYLSDLFDCKVYQNYIYRNIVAPLRDAGVIISSCSHGYKIPTCSDDIYAYINQTNVTVGPMLNRVQKCRQLILMQTSGSLDIFDDASLIKYKRYFGDY